MDLAGDRDQGDYCPTEFKPAAPAVWHPSFEQVKPQPINSRVTEVGRAALARLRAECHVGEQPAPRRQAAPAVSWLSMPELYRRMVVRAAGMPAQLVDKPDRELTEREKAMLRSAIGDMRAWLNTVAAL